MGMQLTDDRRKRFEVLLQQAELPTEWLGQHYRDGHIEKVEISRSRKRWTITVSKETLLPRNIYIGTLERVKAKLGHIADVGLVLNYGEQVATDSIVKEYWLAFVERMQKEVASVNGWLAKADVSIEGDVLTVALLNETNLALARKRKSTPMRSSFSRGGFFVHFA